MNSWGTFKAASSGPGTPGTQCILLGRQGTFRHRQQETSTPPHRSLRPLEKHRLPAWLPFQRPHAGKRGSAGNSPGKCWEVHPQTAPPPSEAETGPCYVTAALSERIRPPASAHPGESFEEGKLIHPSRSQTPTSASQRQVPMPSREPQPCYGFYLAFPL